MYGIRYIGKSSSHKFLRVYKTNNGKKVLINPLNPGSLVCLKNIDQGIMDLFQQWELGKLREDWACIEGWFTECDNSHSGLLREISIFSPEAVVPVFKFQAYFIGAITPKNTVLLNSEYSEPLKEEYSAADYHAIVSSGPDITVYNISKYVQDFQYYTITTSGQIMCFNGRDIRNASGVVNTLY